MAAVVSFDCSNGDATGDDDDAGLADSTTAPSGDGDTSDGARAGDGAPSADAGKIDGGRADAGEKDAGDAAAADAQPADADGTDATDAGSEDAAPSDAGDAGDAASTDAAHPVPDAGSDAGLNPQCPAGSGDGPLGGSRPAAMKIPAGYTPSQRWPLVIELHGRGGTASDAEAAFQMGAMADDNGIFVIAPQGTYDSPPPGTPPATFWNATDGCCNLYGSMVDDVAYLRSLICHTEANYAIDWNKVFIIGFSNGAFMAHRMACDAADLVTAIVAISGVTWKDPAKCTPTNPVSVLHIHGTADTTVPFNGSSALYPGPTPSARATYDMWAQLNHCTGNDVIGPIVDFDQNVPGNETTTVWKPLGGTCTAAAQFWTVNGGTHAPSMAASTKQFFIDWFKATPPNH